MTNKDFITVLLSSYKYTKNINIETSTIHGGTYYEVTAENPETEDCLYCTGESFQNIIYDILTYFQDYKIEISTFALFIPLKYLLDKEEREKYHDNIIKREKEIQEHINETRWITRIIEEKNPCIDCKLNKKDSIDVIHYNCDKCHRNICEYMLKHRELSSYLYQNYKTITQDEVERITNELNENKKQTR